MKISEHPRKEGGLGEKCRYQIFACSMHLSCHVMGPCIYAKASREDLLGLPDKNQQFPQQTVYSRHHKVVTVTSCPNCTRSPVCPLVRAQLLSSPEHLIGRQDSKSMPLPILLPTCNSAMGTPGAFTAAPVSLEPIEHTVRLRMALLLYDGLRWVLQPSLGRKGWGAAGAAEG